MQGVQPCVETNEGHSDRPAVGGQDYWKQRLKH